MRRIGYSSTEDADTTLAWADPIEEDYLRPKGEDAKGLPLKRHPHITLRNQEELFELRAELVDTALGGGAESLPLEVLDERSNAEIVVIHTWRAATGRRRSREIRGLTGGTRR